VIIVLLSFVVLLSWVTPIANIHATHVICGMSLWDGPSTVWGSVPQIHPTNSSHKSREWDCGKFLIPHLWARGLSLICGMKARPTLVGLGTKICGPGDGPMWDGPVPRPPYVQLCVDEIINVLIIFRLFLDF